MHVPRAVERRRARTLFTALPLAAVLLMALGAQSASATHFRGGQITWKEIAPATAQFTFTASFRRGYSGTDSDGGLKVGDVFTETIGDTTFSYGDGTATDTLQFRTIAVNKAENYVVAEALEPGSTTDARLDHTYAAPGGAKTAFSQSCCTISSLQNHPDGDYRVESTVDFDKDDESAIAALNPIVTVGSPGVQSFRVPALDAGGEALRFRLATPAEACGGCSTSESNPAGISIDPASGQVRWDTTGVAVGLYFASFVVESVDASGAVVSKAQQTILIEVIDGSVGPPPGFQTGGTGAQPQPQNVPSPPPGSGYPGEDGTTPPDGTSFYAPPERTFKVKLTATSPNPDHVVHIDHLGLPPGATFTPTDGNPATGLLEWDPSTADAGDYIVSFTVTDLGPKSGGRSSQRAVAGSAISYSLKVVDDKAPPATTASVPACTTTGDATFTVADAGVGAAYLGTAIDGAAEQFRPVGSGGAVTVSVPAEGSHTIAFRGLDNNGNAEAGRTATMVVDRTMPSLSFDGPVSVTQGQAAVVMVAASDSGSGLVENPGGEVSLDTSSPGDKSITRTAKDACGNANVQTFAYSVKAATSGPIGPAAPAAPAKKPATRSVGRSFKLPGVKRCVRRGRTLPLTLTKRRLRQVVVTVEGRTTRYTTKRLRKMKGSALRLRIRDRNGDRKLRVTVTATLRNGGKVKETKRYRICR